MVKQDDSAADDAPQETVVSTAGNSSSPNSEEKNHDRLSKFAPILIPIAPFVVAIFRVVGLAGDDSSARAALLASLDLKAIVLTVVIDQLPFIMIFLGYYLLRISLRLSGDAHSWAQYGGGLCFAGALLLVPWLMMVAAAAVGILVFLGKALKRRRSKEVKKRLRSFPQVLLEEWQFPLLFSFTVGLLYLPSSWQPAEIIQAKGGDARVGYVLKVEDGTTTVLYRNTTRLERIPKEKLEKREICSPDPSFLSGNLWVVIFGKDQRNVTCP
ncbi:hypothetical protein L3Q65_22195 [Amycolatopsis sp. FU40]|uniref:hypothetical protein n=1 Tax=Amycolatopsis sp. FU40 TaxID=2914159 RepID=UPI001F4189E4|nr:hypothetical protein [Amycolatopsis sp. FU40]UKD59318.1 hypothetical protein L3Q65_22195 [Amycolatopsis sp. FU40]